MCVINNCHLWNFGFRTVHWLTKTCAMFQKSQRTTSQQQRIQINSPKTQSKKVKKSATSVFWTEFLKSIKKLISAYKQVTTEFFWLVMQIPFPLQISNEHVLGLIIFKLFVWTSLQLGPEKPALQTHAPSGVQNPYFFEYI